MKIKYIKLGTIISFLCLTYLIQSFVVRAQDTETSEYKVDYKNEIIVDSDLDGLTDKGEQQLFNTDPGMPDTDGDGILDGPEILSGTDPLNLNDPGKSRENKIFSGITQDAPWIWYTVRVAGILGFIFLWLTVFLGLSIRNPFLKKIIEPIYSFDLHCFIAAMAVFWALIHGTMLIFDPKLGFGVKDIFIPFLSQTKLVEPKYLALGIIAFYMMLIMTTTSYLRNRLNHKLWRILHFLNPVAFVFVVVHGFFNGTDMKNFYIGSAYLFSSLLLIFLYISSLFFSVMARYHKSVYPRITSQSNEHSDQNRK